MNKVINLYSRLSRNIEVSDKVVSNNLLHAFRGTCKGETRCWALKNTETTAEILVAIDKIHSFKTEKGQIKLFVADGWECKTKGDKGVFTMTIKTKPVLFEDIEFTYPEIKDICTYLEFKEATKEAGLINNVVAFFNGKKTA